MGQQADWKHVARRIWAWPLAILLGFPIGGLLADLVVDGVDSVGAAIAGGLIAGAMVGAAEWFALREWVSWLWIPATTFGMAIGLTVGAALVDYDTSRGDLVVMGAATGVGVGVMQALVLARRGIAGWVWWVVVNVLGWPLGWLITSYVITKNADEQFTNFGAAGALVFGLLTWVVLALLFRETEPQVRT